MVLHLQPFRETASATFHRLSRQSALQSCFQSLLLQRVSRRPLNLVSRPRDRWWRNSTTWPSRMQSSITKRVTTRERKGRSGESRLSAFLTNSFSKVSVRLLEDGCASLWAAVPFWTSTSRGTTMQSASLCSRDTVCLRQLR